MSATDPSGYFKLKDLLKPLSKDNPLSPLGSVGKYFTLTGGNPEVGEWVGSLATGYYVTRENDRFYTRNPEFQIVPKVVAGVVAYYFPALWWLPATVDAHFTRINGGDTSDVLKTFAVGIATSYVSSEINTYYGNTYTLGRVAVEGVVAGVSSELYGGNFWKGFEVGAGMGLLRYYYVKTMKYDVTWEEGHGLASEDGTYKESLGVPQDKQVFGTNDKLNPDGSGNFWKQGGALSNVANKIPGMNSLARLHDYYQISFGNPSSWTRTLFNVPAMIPATVVNYGALIETLPNYPALFQGRATGSDK